MFRRIILISSVLMLTLPQCVGNDQAISPGGPTSKGAGDDAGAAANQAGIGNVNEADVDDSTLLASSKSEQIGGVNVSWQTGAAGLGVVGLVVWGFIGIVADRQETARLRETIFALTVISLASRDKDVAQAFLKQSQCRRCRKAA